MLGDAAEVLDPGLPQLPPATSKSPPSDRKSTRLNSSHAS